MPRTIVATWAITAALLAAPCMGGLIDASFNLGDGANRHFVESPPTTVPNVGIVAFIMAVVAQPAEPAKAESAAASINSMHLRTHEALEPTGEGLGHLSRTAPPTSTGEGTTPKGTFSTQRGNNETGRPSDLGPALHLAGHRISPEPIMFAFVALMAPVIHPRRIARRVRHLA
jgi:hypothetical protein